MKCDDLRVVRAPQGRARRAAAAFAGGACCRQPNPSSLSTAAAAWMGGGNPIDELVSNVIDAIKETSVSKKYAILGTIIDSMPGNAPRITASIAYHLVLSNDGSEMDSWKQDAALSMVSKVCVIYRRVVWSRWARKILWYFARQSDLS